MIRDAMYSLFGLRRGLKYKLYALHRLVLCGGRAPMSSGPLDLRQGDDAVLGLKEPIAGGSRAPRRCSDCGG